VGYFIVFKCLQFNVRSEIKSVIKEGMALKDLSLIKIHISKYSPDENLLSWKEENEFLYKGNMYDVVRQEAHYDTIYYYCINDLKENELFSGLDKQVNDQMNNHAKSGNYHKIFKFDKDNNFLKQHLRLNISDFKLSKEFYSSEVKYLSVYPDKDSPPPKFFI
jgi:hypothetical protein